MKPILFNAKMVRAILQGRKTVTRRLIKPQPKNDIVFHCGVWQETHSGANGLRVFPPPYQVGDVLYVRENWALTSDISEDGNVRPMYMADYTEKEIEIQRAEHFRWRPSIHMPKNLARIFLSVTECKIVRLQEITADEVLQEGIEENMNLAPGMKDSYYKACFAALWDTTTSLVDKAKYGWDANPWVWAISFEWDHKKPE